MKIFFKKEGEMKTFSGKGKQKEFVARRPVLKE